MRQQKDHSLGRLVAMQVILLFDPTCPCAFPVVFKPHTRPEEPHTAPASAHFLSSVSYNPCQTQSEHEPNHDDDFFPPAILESLITLSRPLVTTGASTCRDGDKEALHLEQKSSQSPHPCLRMSLVASGLFSLRLICAVCKASTRERA